ncbi:MAG TPA: hypothetical protein PK379_01600 [Candidatus Hydrogenedentes bacterium]|nr:hypothetical protein [Candidatus Hydrogenedentota bacterium]HOK88697.1 hypothetical protein [Candidatus Hydrogenedentota bacterium]
MRYLIHPNSHPCFIRSIARPAMLAAMVVLVTLPVMAVPLSPRAYPITPRVSAPSGHAIASFDLGANGIYFMTGDPFYNPGLTLWVHDGSSSTAVYNNPAVFAGSRVAILNGKVYFNDGGDFSRWTYDYFLLNPDYTVTRVVDSTASVSLWGAETGPDNALYASGAEGFGPSRIYRTIPDQAGQFGPFAVLGEMGDASGPLAFAPGGGLYYVPGYFYAGPPVPVYAFSSTEVSAAIADPVTSPLVPGGHAWAQLPTPYTGASGAVVDAFGRLYVSANAWGEPGQLLMYSPQGGAPMVIAEEPAGRVETTRIISGNLVFNTADGIYEMPLPLAITTTGGTVAATAGDPITLSVQIAGGAGTINYQWYRITGQKALVPVGDNLPYYTFTPSVSDDGARFYCEVSDAGFTVDSPEFVLQVNQPTPATRTTALLAALSVIVLFLLARTRRA